MDKNCLASTVTDDKILHDICRTQEKKYQTKTIKTEPHTYKLAIKMYFFSSKDSSDEVFHNSGSSWDSPNCGTQFIEDPGEVWAFQTRGGVLPSCDDYVFWKNTHGMHCFLQAAFNVSPPFPGLCGDMPHSEYSLLDQVNAQAQNMPLRSAVIVEGLLHSGRRGEFFCPSSVPLNTGVRRKFSRLFIYNRQNELEKCPSYCKPVRKGCGLNMTE